MKSNMAGSPHAASYLEVGQRRHQLVELSCGAGSRDSGLLLGRRVQIAVTSRRAEKYKT